MHSATAKTDRTHPTTSLGADEIATVRDIVKAGRGFSDSMRFAHITLEEPDKRHYLSWAAGSGELPDREARVVLVDVATGAGIDMIVSLTHRQVVSSTEIDGSSGRPPVLGSDSDRAKAVLAADARWEAALAARGLSRDDVQLTALSGGTLLPEHRAMRLVRVVAFVGKKAESEMYFHPVDGLTAHVDLVSGTCLDVIDTGVLSIPDASGAFVDPDGKTNGMDTLKPIEITQPEGPSFTVDGHQIVWANWQLQVGYDAREGLILRNVSILDGAERRPIIYRASISELVVPYGDPRPTRYWHSFFDFGEFNVARHVNSLEHGCDCLGEISYLDVALADEFGNPVIIPNAICIHEEDYSILWKHSQLMDGSPESDVRRARRLVVSSFINAGNYDYGFYWYFYLDGTVQFEVKLTGILFPSSYPEGSEFGDPYPYATRVSATLGAHNHQHLFGARLDMMVDGLANNVDEIDAERVPLGPANPYGNAFTRKVTRIGSEAVSGRTADSSVGRVWRISSAERTNRAGEPTSYVLLPSTGPTLMSDPSSSNHGRIGFATKHLFVTQYHPEERYAAGDWVNHSPAGQGIPAYIADDEPLNDADLVVWHTFGVTHFPRLEDWPVMPVDAASFMMKPTGFFDRNPTLGLPAHASDSCEPGGHHGHAGRHGHQ